MLARELAIVLRARITWLVAALGALLCGHSFVLAIDIYTVGSRSVLASTPLPVYPPATSTFPFGSSVAV